MIYGRTSVLAITIIAALIFSADASALVQTDSTVKKAIIAQSIAGYSGNCPCPYNSARNGSSCGRRSAYSRPGGYAPICYEKDVTPGMIKDYRESHPQGAKE